MFIGVGASLGLIAIIVIVVAVVLMKRESIGSPTDETRPEVLKKIELKVDVGRVVKPAPEGNGAEAEYEAAVKEAVDFGDDLSPAVKRMMDLGKEPKVKSILEHLEKGADKGLSGDLNFDAVDPLTPGGEWKLRDMLYAIGTVGTKSSLLTRGDKDKEGSEKAMRATLIWGDRLFHNGVYVAYKSAGLGCVSEGLAACEREYSKDFFADPAKEGAAKEMYAAYLKDTAGWNPKEKLVRRLGPLSKPGDLWNLAEHDEDRAWRIEGVMWLGVAKWTEVSEGPERRAIQKFLQKKATSPDAVMAKRAKIAADFTRMDVRTMRPE